jgi:hypothetical protein
MKQQANVKFCFRPRKTATKIYDMLETGYRNEALVCMYVFEWFKGFMWGCERTLKMIQGMGGYQMLEIQKQLQKHVNLWLETNEWP